MSLNPTSIMLPNLLDSRIVHLAVSPDDDLFLSSAADQTVRLWDVRVPKTVAEVNLGPAAKSANIAFDPEGLIFAVTIGTECIKLFDKREYGNGPFVTFDLSFVQDSNWTSIEFSPGYSFTPCQYPNFRRKDHSCSD